MRPEHFLQQLDDARISEAIDAAEKRTSGEIRVFVSSRDLGDADVITRAAARFEKLGMTATLERNGVLLYFVPRAQKFAVIGDRAIHEKCGQPFWNEVIAAVSERLRKNELTDAIIAGVKRVGEVLARHFPRRPDDQNELRNEVVRD
jgi:uncharacterized membrane protein